MGYHFVELSAPSGPDGLDAPTRHYLALSMTRYPYLDAPAIRLENTNLVDSVSEAELSLSVVEPSYLGKTKSSGTFTKLAVAYRRRKEYLLYKYNFSLISSMVSQRRAL